MRQLEGPVASWVKLDDTMCVGDGQTCQRAAFQSSARLLFVASLQERSRRMDGVGVDGAKAGPQGPQGLILGRVEWLVPQPRLLLHPIGWN